MPTIDTRDPTGIKRATYRIIPWPESPDFWKYRYVQVPNRERKEAKGHE